MGKSAYLCDNSSCISSEIDPPRCITNLQSISIGRILHCCSICHPDNVRRPQHISSLILAGACFPYSPMYLTVSMDPLKSSHWITPARFAFSKFALGLGEGRRDGGHKTFGLLCSALPCLALPRSCQIDGAAPRMAFASSSVVLLFPLSSFPSENSAETVTLGLSLSLVRARPSPDSHSLFPSFELRMIKCSIRRTISQTQKDSSPRAAASA